MSRNYREDIKINENNLEGEWLEQPSLFLHYAEAHADAMHNRDMSKSRMDLCYAKMYSSIKKNWEKHFDSKPTEPAIKEFILKHPQYQKAEKALIDSVKDASIMLAAKTAFDHRKRALENLVSLKIAGFHSEPRNKIKKQRESGGHKAQKESLNREDTRATSRKTKKTRRRK